MILIAMIVLFVTVFISYKIISRSQRALNAAPNVVHQLPESTENPPEYSKEEMAEAQKDLDDLGIRN